MNNNTLLNSNNSSSNNNNNDIKNFSELYKKNLFKDIKPNFDNEFDLEIINKIYNLLKNPDISEEAKNEPKTENESKIYETLSLIKIKPELLSLEKLIAHFDDIKKKEEKPTMFLTCHGSTFGINASFILPEDTYILTLNLPTKALNKLDVDNLLNFLKINNNEDIEIMYKKLTKYIKEKFHQYNKKIDKQQIKPKLHKPNTIINNIDLNFGFIEEEIIEDKKIGVIMSGNYKYSNFNSQTFGFNFNNIFIRHKKLDIPTLIKLYGKRKYVIISCRSDGDNISSAISNTGSNTSNNTASNHTVGGNNNDEADLTDYNEIVGIKRISSSKNPVTIVAKEKTAEQTAEKTATRITENNDANNDANNEGENTQPNIGKKKKFTKKKTSETKKKKSSQKRRTKKQTSIHDIKTKYINNKDFKNIIIQTFNESIEVYLNYLLCYINFKLILLQLLDILYVVTLKYFKKNNPLLILFQLAINYYSNNDDIDINNIKKFITILKGRDNTKILEFIINKLTLTDYIGYTKNTFHNIISVLNNINIKKYLQNINIFLFYIIQTIIINNFRTDRLLNLQMDITINSYILRLNNIYVRLNNNSTYNRYISEITSHATV